MGENAHQLVLRDCGGSSQQHSDATGENPIGGPTRGTNAQVQDSTWIINFKENWTHDLPPLWGVVRNGVVGILLRELGIN